MKLMAFLFFDFFRKFSSAICVAQVVTWLPVVQTDCVSDVNCQAI